MMRVLVIAALGFMVLSAESPDALSGRVLDPAGSPVPEARVSVTGRGNAVRASAVTGSTGEYRLAGLPAGEYLVEAQAFGFGTSTAEAVRLVAGDTVELDLRLEIARVTTQVQVTAAAVAQTVDEQSKALDIIDGGQLARRGEFQVTEAIRTVAGVRIMQLGGPGSFARVLIRGNRASDTSVLLDGIRLRDAAAPQGDATSLLSDLQTANTERVEVLRGSGSSLYGTHATGGVVNIISEQGGGSWRGDLGVEGGGLASFRMTGRFSGSAGSRLRFAGGATHFDVFEGVDGDDRHRNDAGNGFVHFQIAPVTSISGRVMVSASQIALNDSPAAAAALPSGEIVRADPFVTYTPAPNDPDQRRDASVVTSLVALNHNWTPRFSSRLSYANVTTSRDNRDGPLGEQFEPMFPDQYVFDGRLDTLQFRSDGQLDRRHLVTGGYEFEREAFDNLTRDQNPDAAARVDARLGVRQTSHAVFGQAQGRYFDGRLQVLLSGRFQRFQLQQPRYSDNSPFYRSAALPTPPDAKTGDVSLAWRIDRSNTKLRAHAGNGYRAPALYERFGSSFYFGSFSAYGDPRLGPERLLAFDAGFDQYLASSRARVSGTYFYTHAQESIIFDFSGAIVPETDPYSRWGGYRNTGGGIARGAELSVEANPLRTLTVLTTYTYTKALDRRSQYGNSILRGLRASEHMFTATASQRIGRGFDVTVDLFAASDFLAPLGGRAFEFDGLVKADVVAAYTRSLGDRHSVRFYSRIEQVLNRDAYEEGFRVPRAWAVGGIKWVF